MTRKAWNTLNRKGSISFVKVELPFSTSNVFSWSEKIHENAQNSYYITYSYQRAKCHT